jgi:hypothetical protein
MLTHTKLDVFSSTFENESHLRTALVGLLERMPNTSDIRLTHGTLELGKDIVFRFSGPFQETQLASCVVKNGKISGSVEADDGARTVFLQAEQSLDTPVTNPANGQKEKIAQVFVISPYDCAPATVESIASKLEDSAGRVTFLCGRKLLEKFEKYHPEFLLFHSNMYGTYLAELEQSMDSDNAVGNVLFRHGFLSGSKSLSRIYVRPKFVRPLRLYSLNFKLPSSEQFSKEQSESDWIDFCESLSQLAEIAYAITNPSENILPVMESLNTLRKNALPKWSQTYDRVRIQQSIPEKKQAIIKIDEARELAEAAKDLFKQTIPLVTNFEMTLRQTNAFVEKTCAGQDQPLLSDQIFNYSQIEGVSRQVPSLVVEGDCLRKFEYSEGLIDTQSSDLLVTGPAGFGKTSFCRCQALHDLRRLQNHESDVIPIYVPLHQFSQQPLSNFENSFLRDPKIVSLWQEKVALNRASRRSRFRLYLDGLDEVPDLYRQRDILALALAAKSHDNTLALVVTARDHVVGAHLHDLARIQLQEFDEAQIAELVGKWFDNNTEAINDFFRQLGNSPTLQSLMRVPLLATLILAVFTNTETLPESKIRLYDMFVNLLAGGWDSAKKIQRQSEFGSTPKLTVLSKLAMTLHVGHRRDCNQIDFKNAVRNTLPGLEDKWETLMREVVQDGLLIPMACSYTFAHLSFQEFLTAKELTFEPKALRARQAFRDFLGGNDWWREVVLFYIALAGKPKEVEQFIREMAEEVRSKTANDNVKSRAGYLLENLMSFFPGARPDFNFPGDRRPARAASTPD